MANSNIPVTPGSGASVDTFTMASGDHREAVVLGDSVNDYAAKVNSGGDQVMSISSPAMAPFGIYSRMTPFGALRITGEPSTLLWELFDSGTVDTTRWTTGGTVAPTQGSGALSAAPGTTLSATSSLVSQATFPSAGLGYNVFGSVVALETTQLVTPNSHRFWGLGVVNSFAYATPVTDGVGFEIDGTGALNCVVYVGGTRYVLNSTNAALISSSVAGMGGAGTALPTGGSGSAFGAALTWQGNTHRYGMHIRPDSVFFYVEGQDKPVAMANYVLPNVQQLPVRIAQANNTSGTVLSNTFTVNSVGLSDTTAGNGTISDPTYPWRRAQVGRNGGLSIKGSSFTATPLTWAATVVGSSAAVDVSEAGNVTFIAKNTIAASAVTGTPTLVFEQSDDNVSWGPLPVVRADTMTVGSTHVISGIAASASVAFDAGLEGVNYVRVRLTIGTTANGLTVAVVPGGMPFSPSVALPQPVRTLVTYYMALPVQATATDTLAALTVQRGSTTVAASTTPAVVPAGKTFRVTGISAVYIATATSGYAMVRLRCNYSGVVVIGSPIVRQVIAGASTAGTANAAGINTLGPVDGLELPAGAGIGVSLLGMAALAATAVGYANVEISGYEY